MLVNEDLDECISHGRLCISTKIPGIISETCSVMIEEVESMVRVRETSCWFLNLSRQEESSVGDSRKKRRKDFRKKRIN